MNKLMLLGIAATLGTARLAFFPANPPVELQPASPGTAQTGHLNISGTATVGLLKSQGTVFGASTAPTGFAYGGFFTAASNQGRGFYGYASSPTGLTYGGFFQNASDQGRAVFGLGTATSGLNYGGYFQTASTGGRAVFGVATSGTGTTFGVYGRTNSPNGYGVFSEGNMGTTGIISGNGSLITDLNASNLASGTVPDSVLSANVAKLDQSNVFSNSLNHFSTATGAVAVGPRTTGIGINEILSLSRATNDFAGMYISTNPGGKPYYGYSNGTFDAYTYMNNGGQLVFSLGSPLMAISRSGEVVVGGTASPSPTPGSTKLSMSQPSTNGVGTLYVQNGASVIPFTSAVSGTSSIASGSGTAIGVQGWGVSTNGQQAFGVRAVANGTGQNVGVYGEAQVGVSNVGVYGNARVSGTANYGVYGTATDGTTNYAGYFAGLLYATSFQAGTKNFMIDHPLDPENKVLSHSSVESDERMNLYRGVTKTDAQGYAWVSVPGWFDALNKDIQYQLTVIDTADTTDFVLAKVVSKIKDQRFRIRTSQPNVEVNWLLTGVRHDPVANFRPLEVERMKVKGERGKYYDPAAYGKDPSFGMGCFPPTPEVPNQRPAIAPSKK